MKPGHFLRPAIVLPLIAWGTFVFSFSAAGQPAAVRDEIVIVEAQGLVELSTDGGVRWVKTQRGQTVKTGDWLRTGENSGLRLLLSDQSSAVFNELTEIEVLPPHQPEAQAGWRLIRGLFSFFHRDKPGRIRVITRGAAAGVEGTEFAMEVDFVDNVERTTLFVIDGRVRFGNELNELVVTNLQGAVVLLGQAPVYTAGFIVNNVLQWAFYYPAVLNLDELPLALEEQQALAKSMADYRAGELLAALANYPAARQAASDAERVYYAALLLSVGQAAKAEAMLATIAADASPRLAHLSAALRHLIAAVKGDPSTLNPQLSTELLAASYYEQSLGRGDESLLRALELARESVALSPGFAFGWARVAELEFSFGRARKALEALERSLELAPRNPQALALKGFLLAAQNKTRDALDYFDKAIAIDGALGNAWLGRGLVRIRRGDLKGGREDLLIAAAAEPQRSVLRSYLGKAYAEEDPFAWLGRGVPADRQLAEHELALAKRLDPNDPTAWLYSALLQQQGNHINEAVDSLERSQDLNENRALYRSKLLIDQDRAVRSVNLAKIYDEAGLSEVALREASRAVASDYGNYSAHLFLGNSYAQNVSLPFGLRYETPLVSEYLLAALIGPPDGRLLAPPVSQQEYTRLFERDRLGMTVEGRYLSRGAWRVYGAQYGSFGTSAYALEGYYHDDPGETPFREFDAQYVSASFKQMVTPDTSLFGRVLGYWQDAGDLQQRYDPDQASGTLHFRQKQEPGLLAGVHHRWNEANQTLFLATHVNDSFLYTNLHGPTLLITELFGDVDGLFPIDLTQEYENRLTLDSFEVQHIGRSSRLQTIAGVRLHALTHRASNIQTINVGNAPDFEIYLGNPGTVITNQSLRLDAVRISPYVYEHVQVAEPLWLIGGISYDYQEQPGNVLFGPLSEEDEVKQQWSPKAAIVWTPNNRSAVRTAYTRSLGGMGIEQSYRLEPSQVAGFVQAYRSIMPESLVGGIAGARYETADLSMEYRLPSRTYVALWGQLLRSDLQHEVGAFQRDLFDQVGPEAQLNEKLRFQERSLEASIQQLIDDWVTIGARYRISDAWLHRRYTDAVVQPFPASSSRVRGLLHSIGLNGVVQHPSGFFTSGEALWFSQELDADLAALPTENFWQFNVFAGFRSPKRFFEITVGLLNVTDQDYRLYPINIYGVLQRERTFFTRLQWSL